MTGTVGIYNTEDIIDSRDIIVRIETLEDMLQNDDIDADELEELRTLILLAKECAEHVDDWEYGETLIHENYWVEYVEDLIEDCYPSVTEIGKGWPYNHVTIDYESAAEELKSDYTAFDFDGATYYAR